MTEPEIRKFTTVSQRNEIYPAEYLLGLTAFTYRQAVCVKAQQERIMKDDENTIDINLKIVPVPKREGEYYVHNTSTYVKEFLPVLDPPSLPPDSTGKLKLLSTAPLYLGPLNIINSSKPSIIESSEDQ